ncbi:MAG TPA: RHS repeat protein, partial [Nitrospira sp.]|nr:RHS repeat protein [Nitrospira sp.]
LTSLTDPRQLQTQFRYDGLNRVTEIADAYPVSLGLPQDKRFENGDSHQSEGWQSLIRRPIRRGR